MSNIEKAAHGWSSCARQGSRRRRSPPGKARNATAATARPSAWRRRSAGTALGNRFTSRMRRRSFRHRRRAFRRSRGDRPSRAAGARSVEIDLAALAAAGYITPEAHRSQIADEFRVIKRPIIKNAHGGCGVDGRARQPRDGDERPSGRRQELRRAQSGAEHRVGGRQHGASGGCRRGQSESHEENEPAGGERAARSPDRRQSGCSPTSC